ncbi:MAG: ATP-binding protein [Bacteroidota bacterium]
MSSPSETRKLLYKQLILPSSHDIIHDVEAVIDEIRAELEFKEDVYGNVMVAVTEAVNNAVFHGNKEDGNKKVFIDFEVINKYRLVVRVKDEGIGFDPNALPDPTAPENIVNIGGRGVFLMQQLSDELNFSDDGRVSEMVFNI